MKSQSTSTTIHMPAPRPVASIWKNLDGGKNVFLKIGEGDLLFPGLNLFYAEIYLIDTNAIIYHRQKYQIVAVLGFQCSEMAKYGLGSVLYLTQLFEKKNYKMNIL